MRYQKISNSFRYSIVALVRKDMEVNEHMKDYPTLHLDID